MISRYAICLSGSELRSERIRFEGDFNAAGLSAVSSHGVIHITASILNWPQMCLPK